MIHVIGGVYREVCISPDLVQLYGSGGRAATALAGLVGTTLHSPISSSRVEEANRMAALGGFRLVAHPSSVDVSFGYVHPLSSSQTDPARGTFHPSPPIHVEVPGETALVFGMYEARGSVRARTIVYDPQDGQLPVPYSQTGNIAEARLALLLNTGEARGTSGQTDLLHAGRELIRTNLADVVVVKGGPGGAMVFSSGSDEVVQVPAFRTNAVFGIGSGDIFAAAFAYLWGEMEVPAGLAAEKASRAVSSYVETRSDRLVWDDEASLARAPALIRPGRVYLAGPFFTMAQRWLVEEARDQFLSMGLQVFSPIHEVGRGPAEYVGPADLRGLESCDRVFAILDGFDSGTMFELGYARKMGLPVYGYGELIEPDDSKMITGSGCRLIGDFATAVYHTAWRT